MKTRHHISGMAVLSLLLIFLFPAPLSADSGNSLRLKTVVIDAGHGGKDPGCVSRDGRVLEKTVNLDIARKLGAKISAYYPDVKVIYTRTTDVFVTLNNRADIANRNNADLFISIHVNASTSTQPHGFSTHILGNGKSDNFSANMDVCRRENSVILLEDDCTTKYQGFDPNNPESFIFMSLMQNSHLEQSMRFAQIISENLKGGPIKTDRGLWQNSYLVLWRAAMPAVLVELGFISNASDLAILRQQSKRDDLADRLFRAFREYKAIYDSSVSLDGLGESPAGGAAAGGESAAAADVPARERYAVQILVSSKYYRPGDPVFLGYEPEVVRAGKYYKYLIGVTENLSEAKKNLKSIKNEYSDAFLVKIQDGNISPVK